MDVQRLLEMAQQDPARLERKRAAQRELASAKNRILTANEQYKVRKAGGFRPYFEWLCFERWAALPIWDVSGVPLRAFVANSSWVVGCPSCGRRDVRGMPPSLRDSMGDEIVYSCKSRELFVHQPGEPFVCPACLNSENEFLARPVVYPAGYPDGKEWQILRDLLLARPDPTTRLWYPWESAADLVTQNMARGIK